MNVSYLLRNRSGNSYYAIGPEQPLADAVHLMMQHRIGSLVVLEGGRLVGIVTERDVMRAVDDYLPRLPDVTVQDVMTTDPVTCPLTSSVDEAMDSMLHNATGNRIRHLPVLDGERLVGVISIGDIVEGLLTETRFENKLLKHYIKNWPEESPAPE